MPRVKVPRKGGRKAHKPTDETRKLVHDYTAVGIRQEHIAVVLGLHDDTLRKHYREELDTAHIKANASIGGSLFSKAQRGDTAAIIWWEKTRCGYSGQPEQSTDDALQRASGVMLVPVISMEDWANAAAKQQEKLKDDGSKK